MQEHDDAVGEVGFVSHFDDIEVDYDHDTTTDVQLHDGSHLRLRKLHEDYAPTDKALGAEDADRVAREGRGAHRSLLRRYASRRTSHAAEYGDEPLATLSEERVRPSRAVLTEIMEAHR